MRNVRLYADDLEAALKKLDRVPSADETLLEIPQPKAKDSVFMACARVGGPRVADSLQLYLEREGQR